MTANEEIEMLTQESHRREILAPVLTDDERQAVEEREALWKALGYPEKLFEIATALTSAERRGFRRGVDAAAKWLKLTEPLRLAMLRRLASGDE